MVKNKSTRNLQDLWERAIERAIQEKSSVQELSDETLNQAAGVHIQSGVRAGDFWGLGSYTCQNCSGTCGGH
jgi:hypothetical protein